MRCSLMPIEFISAYIIFMNFDSFVSVSIKCLLLLQEMNLTEFGSNNNIYKFIQLK